MIEAVHPCMMMRGVERQNISGIALAAACDDRGTATRSAGGDMATKKKSGGRKKSRGASKDVESAMRRRKRGTLKRGKGGRGGTVKSRKQAIAIGLSEARKKGKKVPRKRSSGEKSSRKRSARKKS